MTIPKLGRRFLAPALLVGLAAATALAQDTVPAVRIVPPGQATQAQPLIKPDAKKADIYDPKADAQVLVAEAVTKAKRDNSRVLVMFGGNWCGWCHKLHATLKSDPKLSRTMLYEYVLVMVDTAAPHAKDVMEKYQVDPKAGVPYLVVLDGEGKVVCNQETGSLEEGDHHDPKKVLDFLTKNAAPPVSATKALDAALAQAASQDKLVFLHFGAPWCGWCHKLEDFLARADVSPIMGLDFVDLKIDVDRMTGGKELQAKFKAEQKGIPWFAFLDRDGKVVADSDGSGGNIGYPAQPDEIAHFIGMLKKATHKTSAEQIGTIERELKAAGAKLFPDRN